MGPLAEVFLGPARRARIRQETGRLARQRLGAKVAALRQAAEELAILAERDSDSLSPAEGRRLRGLDRAAERVERVLRGTS
jgi:hypothetical protein